MIKKKIIKLIDLLRKRKFKIAIVESCTGGLLSSYITSISGASKVYSMGMITYSNKSKINNLKIKKDLIDTYGAVSPQCCLAMVKNLKKISGCDVSVSITGIAGPKGGTKKKPVGLVYIGIKKNKKILIKKYLFKNKKRNLIQRSAANKALNLILSFIK